MLPAYNLQGNQPAKIKDPRDQPDHDSIRDIRRSLQYPDDADDDSKVFGSSPEDKDSLLPEIVGIN